MDLDVFLWIIIIFVFGGTIVAQNKVFFGLLGWGLVFLAFKWFRDWSPTAQHRKRHANPLDYGSGLTEVGFEQLVRSEAKKLKAIDECSVSDGEVTISWQSHSGKTFYDACIDFNDYGKLTGNFWVMRNTEPNGSTLVDRFATRVATGIKDANA